MLFQLSEYPAYRMQTKVLFTSITKYCILLIFTALFELFYKTVFVNIELLQHNSAFRVRRNISFLRDNVALNKRMPFETLPYHL